ncbi:hypothetical protein [Nocardia altamirensis]|uniref:hypothetical protein n=1 Tax=Nocardia altamirensis TaxID=472158 RepID=UPI00083FE27B|nr:hypothetical protein [Nocardia altamirensis]
MSKLRVFGVVLAASGIILAGSGMAAAANLPLEPASPAAVAGEDTGSAKLLEGLATGSKGKTAGTEETTGSATGSAALLTALATGSAGKPAPAPAP